MASDTSLILPNTLVESSMTAFLAICRRRVCADRRPAARCSRQASLPSYVRTVRNSSGDFEVTDAVIMI
jgi:hypothetical protein